MYQRGVRVDPGLSNQAGGKAKAENLYWPETKLMENVIEVNEVLRL